MPKTLDITRILREQKEQLRAGFQDRLVMTTSITLRKYDATACIIFTELLRCGSANSVRRIHFAYHTRRSTSTLWLAQGVGIFAKGEITLRDAYCEHFYLVFRFANFLEKVLEGIIFCFVRRAEKSSTSRLFDTLQKLATANFQDRLVMTASITLQIRYSILGFRTSPVRTCTCLLYHTCPHLSSAQSKKAAACDSLLITGGQISSAYPG